MGPLEADLASSTPVCFSPVLLSPQSYNPTMALASNHIMYIGAPSVAAGSADIFVVHCQSSLLPLLVPTPPLATAFASAGCRFEPSTSHTDARACVSFDFTSLHQTLLGKPKLRRSLPSTTEPRSRPRTDRPPPSSSPRETPSSSSLTSRMTSLPVSLFSLWSPFPLPCTHPSFPSPYPAYVITHWTSPSTAGSTDGAPSGISSFINSTQVLPAPSSKDTASTYAASDTSLVQLTSTGELYYLPVFGSSAEVGGYAVKSDAAWSKIGYTLAGGSGSSSNSSSTTGGASASASGSAAAGGASVSATGAAASKTASASAKASGASASATAATGAAERSFDVGRVLVAGVLGDRKSVV